MLKSKITGMNWARVEILAAIGLSLWVLLLHILFMFHAGPLWRDEVGTIDFAGMPTVSELWQNLQYDNFPPLFVGVARVWTLAGWSGDFSYRVLGFLVGAGTLGVFWFGARAGGARAPLLALALYAANPLAVRVGDAMRPYGLGFALNLLALALIWRFVENPRICSWFWAILAAVLSVQCLYQNAFLLAAFCLAGCAVTLTRRQWKIAAQTAGVGVLAALSLLLHWGNIAKGRDWHGVSSHPVRATEIGRALVQALNAAGPWMVWFWAALAVLAVGTAIVLVVRERSWKMVYFGAALLSATLFYGLFLERIGLQQRPWYFLILLAPAALAMDIILAGLAGRRCAWAGQDWRCFWRPPRYPPATLPCKSANPMPTWSRGPCGKTSIPAISSWFRPGITASLCSVTTPAISTPCRRWTSFAFTVMTC